MRKVLLILLIMPVFGFGQKIEGIGNFRLKKTNTTDLNDLIKEYKISNGAPLYSSMAEYKARKQDNKIFELRCDTANLYGSPSYSHYCKKVKSFYLPSITISNIEVKDMYLIFYNEILVEIKTEYSSEITEAFKLKYGSPKIEKKEEVTKCKLILTGTDISHKDAIYYQTWSNGDIQCVAAIGDYRNDKCEKQEIGYISISSGMESDIYDCDIKEKEAIQKKIESEKRNKLKDF